MDGVISHTYTNVTALQDTTNDGYDFLQLLLLQVPPQLTLKSVAVQNIPKFLDSNNIFHYAKHILNYVNAHKLRHRNFQQEKRGICF